LESVDGLTLWYVNDTELNHRLKEWKNGLNI